KKARQEGQSGSAETRLVEAAMGKQAFPPHCSMSENEVPLQDRTALIVDLKPPATIVVAPHPSPVDNQVGVCGEYVQVRASVRQLRQHLEAVWQVDVIGVENHNEVSARARRRRVLRRGLAAVALSHEDDLV